MKTRFNRFNTYNITLKNSFFLKVISLIANFKQMTFFVENL